MNAAAASVRFLYVLSLAAFVVGDLVIGALALPAVFQVVPERALAGAVASVILSRWAKAQWVCLGVLAVSAGAGAARRQGPAWTGHARDAGLAVVALSFLAGYFLLSPRIEALRPAMAAQPSPAVRERFARLHGAAVSLGSAGALAGLVALYFS